MDIVMHITQNGRRNTRRRLLEKQLTAVLSYKDCMGVYIWQFCDIRISDECFAGRPRTMNNKGIVDEYRRAKLAYDVVKRIYHEIN